MSQMVRFEHLAHSHSTANSASSQRGQSLPRNRAVACSAQPFPQIAPGARQSQCEEAMETVHAVALANRDAVTGRAPFRPGPLRPPC